MVYISYLKKMNVQYCIRDSKCKRNFVVYVLPLMLTRVWFAAQMNNGSESVELAV